MPHPNRRDFLKTAGLAATFIGARGDLADGPERPEPSSTLFVVPNTHGTIAGWLDDFDTERNYVLNNYLDHLDRVRSDPNYRFVYSEVANLITFLQFAPDRLEELKTRILEGRVELCNAFFVESTISISGGEALAQLGVQGLRWYEKFFGLRPRHAWTIDVVGNHRQMPQLAAGLGLKTIIFCRNNPANKTAFRWVAPDGTKILTICNANSYAELERVFTTKQPLTTAELDEVAATIDWKKQHSPSSRSLLALAGSGDYSLAPARREYPSEFLEQCSGRHPNVRIRFSTLTDYVEALDREVRSGEVQLEEYQGDAAYCFNAFWYDMPQVKKRFRHLEHCLQAAEMLAAVASCTHEALYPSQALYNAWINMLVNMDRNALWGSAAGKVFRDEQSWDAEDRYNSVEQLTGTAIGEAMRMLTPAGENIAFFNPVNWDRSDPIELPLPANKQVEGVACECLLDDGTGILCRPRLPSAGLATFRVKAGKVPRPEPFTFDGSIENNDYVARVDQRSGALVSLKLKSSGRELVGGPANVVMAESIAGMLKEDPGDFMLPRPQRKMVGVSSDHAAAVQAFRGPLATTVTAKSDFYGGSKLNRIMRFYHQHPRIDFETRLDWQGKEVLVTVDFPLAGEVVERTRGIPFGFASIDPRHPVRPIKEYQVGESEKYGFSDAILPAVRWSHYQLAGGCGVALLDRGLTAHELNGSTVTLGFMNSHASYNGWPNPMMAGEGAHQFSYALVGHDGRWQDARVPRLAWEFNAPALTASSREAGTRRAFLQTSDNLIIEALRLEGRHIEVRLCEWKGAAGTAEVTIELPHHGAALTNFMGENATPLSGGPDYRFPVRPQQIVTIRLDVYTTAAPPQIVGSWSSVVPESKQKDLGRRLELKGHPPFGYQK